MSLATGYGSTKPSGTFSLRTADAGPGGVGVSGGLFFKSGTTSEGSSGAVVLRTGVATKGAGGSISLVVGRGNKVSDDEFSRLLESFIYPIGRGGG